VLEDFDEMRIEPVFREQIASCSSGTRTCARSATRCWRPGRPGQGTDHGRLFEGVVTMWAKGQIAADGVETWEQFLSRVQRGLQAAQEFRTDGNLARAPSGRRWPSSPRRA